MKKWSGVVLSCLLAFGLRAQTAPGGAAQPPPGAISSARGTNTLANGAGATNPASAAVTVDQLATQLQSLRGAVEQTLPALTEFNQRVSAQQSHQGLTGALSSLFSKDKNASRSTGQEITNVLSALGALVNTNAQGQATINPNTINDLVALQNDLRQVQQVLGKLNLGVTNQVNATAQPNSGLTPTGR